MVYMRGFLNGISSLERAKYRVDIRRFSFSSLGRHARLTVQSHLESGSSDLEEPGHDFQADSDCTEGLEASSSCIHSS